MSVIGVAPTFAQARVAIHDYATENSIDELTSNSNKNARSNTFVVDGPDEDTITNTADPPKREYKMGIQNIKRKGEDCKMWKKGLCRYQKSATCPGCIFKHVGKGGYRAKDGAPAVFTCNVQSPQTEQEDGDWVNNQPGMNKQPELAGVFIMHASQASSLVDISGTTAFADADDDTDDEQPPDLMSSSNAESSSRDMSQSGEETFNAQHHDQWEQAIIHEKESMAKFNVMEPATAVTSTPEIVKEHAPAILDALEVVKEPTPATSDEPETAHANPGYAKTTWCRAMQYIFLAITIATAVTAGVLSLAWDITVATSSAVNRRRPTAAQTGSFLSSLMCLVVMISLLAGRHHSVDATSTGLQRPPSVSTNINARHGQARVSASVYLSQDTTDGSSRPARYQWCADSGANRFVTNDDRDFEPGTVSTVSINVSVGGGNIVATKTGSVLVYSPVHDHMIRCEDVLFLPSCSTKLMPVSKFARKGGSMHILSDGTVTLKQHGKTLLSGREFDGLYYYDCISMQPDTKTKSKQKTTKGASTTPEVSTALFGLEANKTISATHIDFSQKLIDAHCAYGHINFNSLRKILGLKPGDNPQCTSCTVAKSKAESLI